MKVLQLGTIVTDTVSGTKGMLTHLTVDMEEHEEYIYQPRGLNPDTMQPVGRTMISKSRIKGATIVDVDLPLNVLGSQAEDIATGFKGTVISLIYHINGCLHVAIKPKGKLKNGDTIEPAEFDIRRVIGPKITPLNAKQLTASIKATPSPSPLPIRKISR